MPADTTRRILQHVVLIAAPGSLPAIFDAFGNLLRLGPRSRAAIASQVERIAGRPLAEFTGARQLAGTPLPTLVIHAPEDREVPAGHAELYASAGSHVRLHWTPGLGHRRILFLMRRGRRTILTVGGIGTNWGLAAALYGREQGIDVVLALIDQPVDDHVRAQLERLRASGATIHRTRTKARTIAAAPWLMLRHRDGLRPTLRAHRLVQGVRRRTGPRVFRDQLRLAQGTGHRGELARRAGVPLGPRASPGACRGHRGEGARIRE